MSNKSYCCKILQPKQRFYNNRQQIPAISSINSYFKFSKLDAKQHYIKYKMHTDANLSRNSVSSSSKAFGGPE
jgi:hypothetical protein